MGLEARCRVLLNLGFEGAIELPLLIVHLTQDHVVLQEEFVSHTKPRKSKQENESMGRVPVGSRTHPSIGVEVIGEIYPLSFPERVEEVRRKPGKLPSARA
jgi:hypothetical protein